MSDTGVQDRVVPAQRPVTVAAGGAFVTVCALAAAVAAVVPGRSTPFGSNFSAAMWPLLFALVVAGVVVTTDRRWARPAAVVAAIVAAQVAGHALVTVRDWFTGTRGMAQHDLATVVTCAAVVAICATAAAVAATAVVWREPAAGWRGLLPARPAYVAAGAAVALLLPPALSELFRDGDITTLGQFALTYSLPWGAGLAAVGWLHGRSAMAARVTVAVCVVLCAVLVLRGFVTLARPEMNPAGD